MKSWFDYARLLMKKETIRQGKTIPTVKTVKTGYSDNAVVIFQNWFDKHSDHPYPDNDEKERLAKESGLTIVQVREKKIQIQFVCF